MRKIKKEQRFFNPLNPISQHFSLSTLNTVHFGHNALLAYSAVMIDHFITNASRKFNMPAKRLLARLDLLKVHPRYPCSDKAPNQFATAASYLHQLCIAATTPTLMLWLMRSMSLTLKELCLEELAQNEHYYNFVYGQKINLYTLDNNDPNRLNPYVGLVLHRALEFEFMQNETHHNKKIPRVFYTSKPKLSSIGVRLHWDKGLCLSSAMVEHVHRFSPLMSNENTRYLLDALQRHQPTLTVKHHNTLNNVYLKRYHAAYIKISEQALSLTELKHLYFDALDSLPLSRYQHNIKLPLEPSQQSKQAFFDPSRSNIEALHKQSLNLRIYTGLQDLLCKLIALEIIPEPSLHDEDHSLNRLLSKPSILFSC